MIVDNSILRATKRCDTEAVVRYGMGYRSADTALQLSAGRAVDQAVEVWYATGKWPLALAQLKPYYQAVAMLIETGQPVEPRFEADNVRDVVAAYFEQHPREAMPFESLGMAQRKLAMPLVDGIAFAGVIDDLVRHRGTGRLYVKDVKTTGRLNDYWRKKWQWSTQMTGYVELLNDPTVRAQLTDVVPADEPIVGVFIEAIELSKLPTSDRKCRDHAMPYSECRLQHANSIIVETTRTLEQRAQWREDAIRLARKYARLVKDLPADGTFDPEVAQNGMFDDACAWCEFQRWCGIGRQAHAFQGMLVHDPWFVQAEEE